MPVALCTGGTGVPNTGSAAVVDFATAALGVYLSQYGASWALRAIPFVSLAPITLSAFCATDPPAIPTFTSAEASSMLEVKLDADFFSGISKLGDLITHLLWYQNCHCSTGTPVALPAAPAPPSGTPILQPLPVTSGPCVSAGPFGPTSVTGTTPTLTAALNFARGDVTLVRYFGTDAAGSGSPHITASFGGTWARDHPNSDTGIVLPDCTWASGASFDCRFDVPATIPGISTAPTGIYGRTHASGSAVELVTFTVEYYCGGALPGVGASPCCPPDPATQSSLDAILAMVTLIQRQHVPFASIHGAAHTGLSGTGQFAVSGILGLAVTATTIPPRAGVIFGSPDERFGIGWVNVGTADGWGPRQFITSSPFIWEPIGADVTLVGYSIPPDVTVTIAELVREP
jgi:hypothetical protein